MALALVVVLLVAPGPRLAGAQDAPSPAPRRELSKSETEALVRRDLAARLRIAATVPRLVESSGRTWPDRHLGCMVRRGLEESAPVPGYRFVMEVDGQRVTYHTDRAGRLVRCETPKKPFDPIVR